MDWTDRMTDQWTDTQTGCHLFKQSHQLGLACAGFLLQGGSEGVFFIEGLRILIHPLDQLLPLHLGSAQWANQTGCSPCAPLQQRPNAFPVGQSNGHVL